ncbi:MAG: GNAT family N-acetyltransferase [Gammaproteobacteria bacterium]|nr:GNAT family N-acetyltransferase [Gammaproteobacteria bacterium]
MNFEIREAQRHEGESILSLLPRLASFDIPTWRSPQELWQGDAETLKQWMAGEAPHCHVLVAVADANQIVGTVMLRIGPELLNREPSSHIEVLVVTAEAEGTGVGQALMVAAERVSREHGARTVTLHVFEQNWRARSVYQRLGYSSEIMRFIKVLE